MEIPLLTKGESKAYIALVELGESSIGNIIKVSGVSHSKIYDILKRLAGKGLVSSINKNGKQYFSPADPEALNRLIDEKRNSLETKSEEMDNIIMKLDVRRNTQTPKSLLSSFEGIKGMKNVLDSVIEEIQKGDEILILGTPKQMIEQAGGFLKDWQKRRIKKGVICKIVGDIDAPSWSAATEAWWDNSKKKGLTFMKRSKAISPAYLVITPKSVTTIYFAGNILSFKVEHPEIAQRYKAFFQDYWEGKL